MDTLTHVVLGACIGEAIAGKQLGKKAILLGAFAQNIPDFDIVASLWLPVSSGLLAHRGFSHSFLFLVIFTPLLAILSGYFFKSSNMSIRQWVSFWGIQIFIHLFIDAFNAYGTGWFEPFSHYRVSFNTLFVADPLFTIWPAFACIALSVIKITSTRRKMWVSIGLGFSSLYLLLSIAFKLSTNNSVKNELQSSGIKYTRYFTTPTPLNDLLWYIVAENDSGYYIGYKSVLDKTDKINFHFDYRNDSLLKPYRKTRDLDDLLRFSNGYYIAALQHDTLVFNDLRFGEILGWSETKPKFVFYYYMQYPRDNNLVCQRGRFAGWNNETLGLFFKRIKGI